MTTPKRNTTLEGRTIWITGAGRGLGRGIALAVAEAGANVVVSDIDRDGVEDTTRAVRESGQQALACVADVTDTNALERVFAAAAATLGPIDGLVANAGVLTMNPTLDETQDSVRRQMAINVDGLLACCQAAARVMIKAKGGSIVNIASNAGKVGYPNMAVYNASKAAVISLTRTLAAEWASHNINVNAVCPGGVDTPMLADVAEWIAGRTGDDPAALLATMVPAQIGRHIKPIEVGRVVAFLLSSQAEIIRGQAINIDGGDTPY